MKATTQRIRLLIGVAALVSGLSAQEVAWRISGVWNNNQAGQIGVGGHLVTIGDVNGDGWVDFTGGRAWWTPTAAFGSLTVFSGRDGAVINSFIPTLNTGVATSTPAGDMDNDGGPDYAATITDASPALRPTVVEVRRAVDHTLIWSLTGPAVIPNGYGSVLLGGLDLDGDRRPDLVVVDVRSPTNGFNGDVFAHDNQGNPLWSIQGPPGFFYANGLAALDDLDGDGGDDFVMAVAEFSGRGAGVMVSGRTGSIIRIVYGERVGDNCSKNVVNAGDLDGDGVADFALGGGRTSVQAFSAATGNRLHVWRPQGQGSDFAWQLAGGVDLDQDGIPDLVASAPNETVFGTPVGRIHALSGRDGSFLYSLMPDPNSGMTDMGLLRITVLPPQPGHPYPLFVYGEPSHATGPNDWTRITCVRGNPVRVTPFGSGCGLSAAEPLLGMRPLAGGFRLHLSGAPAGALGFLAVGLSNQQAAGGIALPFDLTPLGWPGCQVLVAPDLVAAVPAGSQGIDAGYARLDVPRPLAVQGGIPLFAQWLVWDATGLAGATGGHAFFLR